MIGAPQILMYLLTTTTTLSEADCNSHAGTCHVQPTSLLPPITKIGKAMQTVENSMVWRSLKSLEIALLKQSAYELLLVFYSNGVTILHHL